MSSFTGMDIQAVRTLAAQLTAKAGDIDTLRRQLTGQLENTPWIGPDREQFYGDWTGHYSTALNQVAEGLRTASQRATTNANEQEQTSSSGGTGSPREVPTARTMAVGEDGTQPPEFHTLAVGEDGTRPPDDMLLHTMAHGLGEDGTSPPEDFLRTMAVGEDGTQPPDDMLLHTLAVGEDGTRPPELFARTMAVGEDGTQPPDEP